MEINYKAQVEAILFTMGESVEKNRIAKALDITQGQLKKIVKEMQEDYAKDHRGIKIIELENSYQLCTKPELYETLIRVAKQPKRQVLTETSLKQEEISYEEVYCSIISRRYVCVTGSLRIQKSR